MDARRWRFGMSNFERISRHPETGELVVAKWLDDYFGKHQYEVKFPDGKVFAPSEIIEAGKCHWAYDSANEEYETECSDIYFPFEGVDDNMFEYCPLCGKAIDKKN